MGSFLQCPVVLFLLFSVISSLQWGPSPRDGETFYACEGQDVTIPWTFNLTAGEDITSIEWLFRGASQEMVAMYTHGAFMPLPVFSGRVEPLDNGGLILRHVTKEDAGNMTVEVNGLLGSTLLLRESRTVTLQINDGLLTTGHQLHVTQEPGAVLDTASQEWSIVLTCGQFTYTGPPAFPVEWVTPSGSVLPSSSYRNGNFYLHLASPVQAGTYVCQLAQQHLTSSCLHGNQDRAGVEVDGMEARVALLEAELRAKVRQDREQLTQDLGRLRDNLTQEIARLTQENVQLRQENSQLMQRLDDMEATQQRDNATLTHLIRDKATPLVAFNAKSTNTQSPADDPRFDHVLFDDILYNQGNAFNSTTGEFTAPVSGLYVLYFHTLSDSNHEANAFIMVNGKEVCRMYTDEHPDHASCQGATHMTAGEKAWVEATTSGMYYTGYTTSFTGFLVAVDPE